jgi:hypothetical protein
MMRIMLAFVVAALLGTALTGCRAEVEADDHSQISAPR